MKKEIDQHMQKLRKKIADPITTPQEVRELEKKMALLKK
jgi:hypothetical protein